MLVAPKELNKGACFTDYSGKITEEISNFTSAYISKDRGTLKLPDVQAEDYYTFPQYFPLGDYHVFDYMFFYRNILENVKLRINTYLKN